MNYQYSVLSVATFALFGISACGKCISKSAEQHPHQREHLSKASEGNDPSALKDPAQSGPRAQGQPLTVSEIKRGTTDFSLRLYSKESRRSDDDRNFVIAPMSVYLALGVARGAVAGESAGQMDQVLALPPQRDAKATAEAIATFAAPLLGSAYNEWTQATAGVTWASATGFFAGKGLEFNPDFVRRVGVSLGVSAQNQPFIGDPARSSREINRWVQEETSDQIEGFLDSKILKPSTQLLLVSAIWFNGDWLHYFDKKMTRPRPFLVKGKQRKVVPTMSLVASFRTLETPQFRAVSLPYQDLRLSMIVVVPKQESDLQVLESELNVHELARSIDRSLPQRTELTLPRLRIEAPQTISLVQSLREMGMMNVFEKDKADLSPMVKGQSPIAIDDVVHKATLILSEGGGELPSPIPTKVKRVRTAAKAEFHIDRPFLFFVRFKPSETVLLAGRVVDPIAAK